MPGAGRCVFSQLRPLLLTFIRVSYNAVVYAVVCVQMVEKQGWTYVSKPSQLVRDAHEAVSVECWWWVGALLWLAVLGVGCITLQVDMFAPLGPTADAAGIVRSCTTANGRPVRCMARYQLGLHGWASAVSAACGAGWNHEPGTCE